MRTIAIVTHTVPDKAYLEGYRHTSTVIASAASHAACVALVYDALDAFGKNRPCGDMAEYRASFDGPELTDEELCIEAYDGALDVSLQFVDVADGLLLPYGTHDEYMVRLP